MTGRRPADGMEDTKNSFKFWRALGDRDAVRSAEDGGDDLEFEKDMDEKMKLYECAHARALRRGCPVLTDAQDPSRGGAGARG